VLIARVVGEVVATIKHPTHEGRKALLVQPLDLDGSDSGTTLVALDAVDAGIGDRVLVTTEGYSAMTSVGRGTQSPIDSAVIGVVDRIDVAPPAPRPL
jgi:ethanolamine utilization protein EutN